MANSQPYNCLIVEDDSEDLFLIELAFDQLTDVVITSVSHLSDADERLSQYDFDLMLVSIGRGTPDQVRLVREFCQQHQRLPVYATVGYTEVTNNELAAKCGAVGVLTKETINSSVIGKIVQKERAFIKSDDTLIDEERLEIPRRSDQRDCSVSHAQPANTVPSPISNEQNNQAVPDESHSRKILVVDDDDADRYLIRRQLICRKSNLDVALACDGIEAIETLLELADNGNPLPDLVLMDLNMPRKSGHETLKEIRADERFSDLPVVILSTSVNPEDKNRALDNQASDFVCKPGSMSELSELLGSLTRKWL